MMFEKKKLLLILAALIAVVSIPLTILQLQKQQELRQRAAGNPVTLTVSPNTGNKAVGEEFDTQLFLSVADNDVTGFDFKLRFDRDLIEVVSFQPSTVIGVIFTTPLASANQTGFLRHITSNNTPNPIVVDEATRTVAVGTLRLKARAEGTATANFQDVKVTAKGQGGTPLPTGDHSTISYTIGGAVTPATSPSPTGEPTATSTPSPSPTGEPSGTPVPTATPTPSPIPATPTPSGPALTLALKLGGIGKEAGKNDNPRTKTPTVEVLLFDQSEQPINTGSRITGNLTYGDDGLFRGTVYVGTAVQPGTYLVKVKTDRYLVRLLPGLVSVPGTVTSVPELVAGNINGDDRIDILDYEALRSCYEARANTPGCKHKETANLNDDEVGVDLLDYKLLFLAFTVQRGD